MMCVAEDYGGSSSHSGGGRNIGGVTEHPNKDTICRMFGVSEIDQVPGYEEGCMFFVENVYSVCAIGIVSIVRGKAVVFDQDKYCEYVFWGVSPGLSVPKFPGDAYIAEGVVYGVNSPSDYSGLFFGATANMVGMGEGGAKALNGVSAKILVLEGYLAPTFGVSGNYYVESSPNWTYGKAHFELTPSRYNGFFDHNPPSSI